MFQIGPKSLGGRVKVELDLYNYATKPDLKNAIDVDIAPVPPPCPFLSWFFFCVSLSFIFIPADTHQYHVLS